MEIKDFDFDSLEDEQEEPEIQFKPLGKDWQIDNLFAFPPALYRKYKDKEITFSQFQTMYRLIIYRDFLWLNWHAQQYGIRPANDQHPKEAVQAHRVIFDNVPAVKRFYELSTLSDFKTAELFLQVLMENSEFPLLDSLQESLTIFEKRKHDLENPPIKPNDRVKLFKNMEMRTLTNAKAYAPSPYTKKGAVLVSDVMKKEHIGALYCFEKASRNDESRLEEMKELGIQEIPKIISEAPARAFRFFDLFNFLYDKGYRRISFDDYWIKVLGMEGTPPQQVSKRYAIFLSELAAVILTRRIVVEKDGKISKWEPSENSHYKPGEKNITARFYFLPIEVCEVEENGITKVYIELVKKPVLAEIYEQEKNMTVSFPLKAIQHRARLDDVHAFSTASYIENVIIGTMRGRNTIRHTRFELAPLYEYCGVTRNKQRVRTDLDQVLTDLKVHKTKEVYAYYIEKTNRPKYFYLWQDDEERNADIKTHRLPLNPVKPGDENFKPKAQKAQKKASDKVCKTVSGRK